MLFSNNDAFNINMSQANIILLYRSSNKSNIKNYRPISLQNSDYKILTNCLSNRLQLVIPKIIKKNQLIIN